MVVVKLHVGLKRKRLLHHFEAQRMLIFARDCMFWFWFLVFGFWVLGWVGWWYGGSELLLLQAVRSGLSYLVIGVDVELCNRVHVHALSLLTGRILLETSCQ